MTNNQYNLNDCKIIKELGHGIFGTTYLVELNSNQYALKIEKISNESLTNENDSKYVEWREIDFSFQFGNYYPEQFIKLYSYDVIDNCNYVNPSPIDISSQMPQDVQKRIEDKNNSMHCIRKLYSLVDTTLNTMINDLNKNQIYSMVIQNLNIIWLLDTNGYTHNDLHGGNIGVIYTNQEYVNVLDNQIPIPTFGNIFVALDFGNMTKNSPDELNHEGRIRDTMKIISRLVKYQNKFVLEDNLGKTFQTNKLIKVSQIDKKKITKMRKTKQWKKMCSEIKLNSRTIKPMELDDKIILFQMLYSMKFQKILLGEQYTELNNLVYKMEIKNIIYFIKNKNDLRKMIKYFVCEMYQLDSNKLKKNT